VELEATTVEVVEVQAATVAQPATMPAGPEASGATPEVQVSPAATPAGEKPDGETQAGEQKGEEAKAGEGKEGEKKDEKAAPGGTLARPTKPPKPADPKELEAKPDKNGRVEFSFNGQPWPDVLQWLAGVSGFSLDWQELPADYLNLSTQLHPPRNAQFNQQSSARSRLHDAAQWRCTERRKNR
jgi:uncharacterized low-complexity protein